MHSSVVISQVVRSADKDSTGEPLREQSIHQAYLQSINESKHFIYIEVSYHGIHSNFAKILGLFPVITEPVLHIFY